MTNTTKPYRRGQQLVRPFTASEDALIESLRCDGLGTTAIASLLLAKEGSVRSPATINMRLKTLARIAENS